MIWIGLEMHECLVWFVGRMDHGNNDNGGGGTDGRQKQKLLDEPND